MPFVRLYVCGFPCSTLQSEDMADKAGKCPPGSFWGAFHVFLVFLLSCFLLGFRTSEEKFSLYKSKLFHYYYEVKEQGLSTFESRTENLSSRILVSHPSVTCDVT